ncbi:ABC transporter ATP-binding protein [Paucibacter sp. DJ2R-2]|uniref:ABC transporter ATP-binding protein n=1 Tax=Paucibacter sp. DJ2R-2 TaxID=2893558 RepID=UPI0021E4FEF4|nr:ABC transporter ATP-binding protein [Paucibacter sp. DJ2R-2]MCV2421133.1 ABC transporter ATP-binding protein [Paucibacter sp. DJ4R-1]MCV2439111.1 ABC transporter ATP-binding protein [Paucibacter sp. DJ2R-2]
MKQELLQAQALHKRYGTREAVRGLSLTVGAGEVLGLLGPNGAGKSSTIAMLAGLSRPDGGSVTVGGAALSQDEFAYKRRIGLVPQELALFEDLPALANIELFGALYELPAAQLKARALAVLAQVGLAERAQDKPSSFSGGMKRRLNIACALVHEPDVLLLDEPTAGVDPQSRNAIFEQLEALKRAGKALIYTTHYMEEVERLADRVIIMDHGQQVAHGSLAELYRLLPAAETLKLELDREIDGALEATLRALPGVQQLQARGSQLQIGLSELGAGSAAVLSALAAAGLKLRHISSGRANLEDVFLALTGRQLRD